MWCVLLCILFDCIFWLCVAGDHSAVARRPSKGEISPIWIFVSLAACGLLLLLYLKPGSSLRR